MIVTVILAIIAAGVLLAIWGVQEYTYSQNAKLDELYSQASPAVRERIDIEADSHVRESKRYKSESRNEVRGNPLIDDLILFSNPRIYTLISATSISERISSGLSARLGVRAGTGDVCLQSSIPDSKASGMPAGFGLDDVKQIGVSLLQVLEGPDVRFAEKLRHPLGLREVHQGRGSIAGVR